MCVIIHRKPGITIPHEKLISACKVNADGMGLIAIDRGKLELRKHFDGKGNSPEVLEKFLEDAKDLHVYVHLRFRTKGETNKDNVHPFGILKTKKHGIDLQFMHNGTLSDYGNADTCDSKDFVKKMVTPLAERFMTSVDPSQLLHDRIFVDILTHYAGRNSVFLLCDNLGNHQIINYDNGKEFEGWWASNEYSFNRYHREPEPNYGSYYSKRRSYWNSDGDGWVRDVPQKDSKVVTLPPVPAGNTPPAFNDEVPFSTKEEAKTEVATKPQVNPTTAKKRRLFIEEARLKNLSEVCQLSSEQIKDMIDDYPEETYMLIRDLLKELWDRDVEGDDEVYEVA